MNSFLKLRRAAFIVGFDVGTTVTAFIVDAAVVGAAVVGFDEGAAVPSLVLYLLGHFSLLGFVMMYESTVKAALALLSSGVTQDLLKF